MGQKSEGKSRMIWLGFRTVLWAVLLPGFFAGFVPWRYFGLSTVRLDWSSPRTWAGLAVTVLGVMLLLACIWEFARRGRGTLSPVDPPRALVVQGLYRHVRNPMYLSVTLIVFGEVLLGARSSLLVLWVAWFGFINLFILLYEEPVLRRQFGASYEAYARAVPRWLPTLRPYPPPPSHQTPGRP